MWKRLDEQISLSEKHAKLSWEAFGIWTYILPNTDSKGRYPADPRVIKARCLTYRAALSLESVEAALLELQLERVIHLFDMGGKRYLVIHDHEEWNPPGALRYAEAKYPSPPLDLCECQRRERGVKTPLVRPVMSTSDGSGEEQPSVGVPSDRSSPTGLLIAKAEKLDIPEKPATLRRYIGAWVARSDYTRVEQILSDQWCKGRSVIEIQDHFFPRSKGAPDLRSDSTGKTKCLNCGGTGKVAQGVENGHVKYGPCRHCQPRKAVTA